MSTLDLNDANTRSLIRGIAVEVADKLTTDLKEHFNTQIELHQANCPTKINVDAIVNQGKGGKAAVITVAAIVATLVGAAWTVIIWMVEHGQ